MDKKPQSKKSNTKDELVMYVLLFTGVSAIVSLFAINVILINKIMYNTIEENLILQDSPEINRVDNLQTDTSFEFEDSFDITVEEDNADLLTTEISDLDE